MAKKYSLEQLSQIADETRAMKMSMNFICEKLTQDNKDKNKEYKITADMGFYADGTGDCSTYVEGYNLIQRTLLEKPIIKKKFFGLIKKEINHKKKTLVYGDIDERTLYVKQNDKNLIKLCEKIVKISKNPLGKNHLYLGLDF